MWSHVKMNIVGAGVARVFLSFVDRGGGGGGANGDCGFRDAWEGGGGGGMLPSIFADVCGCRGRPGEWSGFRGVWGVFADSEGGD